MLEIILKECIQTRLRIPLKKIGNFKCIVAIPFKTEARAYLDLFLGRIGFKECFLHLEPVLVSFGYGPNVCVVDIGSS